MKKQIRRISPHQNAKVFAILMAVSSLVFVIPVFALAFFAAPPVDQHGNSIVFQKYFFVALPFVYFIIGYLTILIGSIIYNYLFKFIGGFEYEVNDQKPTLDSDGKDQIESGASAFKIL